MLDQTFTAENFRRIYESENRKGLDLASKFFPSLKPHTLNIRAKISEIRDLRSKEALINQDTFKVQIGLLKAQLADLKEKKSAAIDDLMEKVSSNVLKTTFTLSLTQKNGPKGKPVFCIDGLPETFFVVKQLQHNISRIYKVKQSNRHDLVCQLRDTVESKFPFEIVRTDISSFYESIDRKVLLEKIDQDQLLSTSSKKYIKQIMDSYGALVGASKGIPRGVGISAYLAELSLRPIDSKIRQLPGLILYCRFVDDVVAVFARPVVGANLGSYKDIILNILKAHGLSHNPLKTAEYDLGIPGIKECEYLGYKFTLSSGSCAISPSKSKLDKYESRIAAAFDDYNKRSPVGSRQAFRELVARVKFLTGNTRLLNSKSSAVTGIYYNNSIVTDLAGFLALDKVLKARVDQIPRPSLRTRLKKYKFSEGFSSRRFHNFSTKEFRVIVKAWKHG